MRYMRAIMAVFEYELESTIRGYHHYKTVWTAVTGQVLEVKKEEGNHHDPYAVCIQNNERIIGHVPKRYSRIFWSFLNRGGHVEAIVTGPRKFADDLEHGGPCKYLFVGEKQLVRKAKKLVTRCID